MVLKAEEKSFDVPDFFGEIFEPGDIFLYCPGSSRGSSLRIGVFIKTIVNGRGNEKVLVQLVTPDGRERSYSSISPETFSTRASIISNPWFYLRSDLMKMAIQVHEKLSDEGAIPSGSPERIQE